jgi:hypothetical protein
LGRLWISQKAFSRSTRVISSVARPIQARPKFGNASRIIVDHKANAATQMVSFIIPTVGSFMLAIHS